MYNQVLLYRPINEIKVLNDCLLLMFPPYEAHFLQWDDETNELKRIKYEKKEDHDDKVLCMDIH